MANEIEKYFCGVPGVITHGDFIGKSDVKYKTETDIRKAMTSFRDTLCVAEELLKAIDNLNLRYDGFLGVPETGSLLAFVLNYAKYQKDGKDFSLNMLRSVAKEYQESTDSVYTVLPLNKACRYVLIEDDAVTGSTLLRYLDDAIKGGVSINAVVVVFLRDEDGNLQRQIKQKYNINLYGLIRIKRSKI